MKQLFLIIIVVLFSTICFAEQESDPVTVLIVDVQNDTKDGAGTRGDEVTVKIYHHEELLQTLHGNVRPDGKAVFTNVPAEDHSIAVVSVKHLDMMFSGEPAKLLVGEAHIYAVVPVYDVSFDKSKLSVLTHHFIIKVYGQALKITEYVQIENSSDMAITSKEEAGKQAYSLEMLLPKGFEDLECLSYLKQSAVIETKDGFYDTMAIPPGQHHPAFSYSLDIDSESVDVVKKFSLPTSNFVVFAEIGQAELTGLGEPTNKGVGADGSPVRYYKVNNISPGDKLEFNITGFNVSSFDKSEWVVSAVVFAGVILLVMFRMMQSKKDTESQNNKSPII